MTIDMKKPLDELTEDMSTSERFEFMYEYAELNSKKGKKGGCCNITQCQKEGACSYNGSTDAYYCTKCWDMIYASATYNGLQEVDWIKEEYREPDFTFEYEGPLPDIILSMPELTEKQKQLLEEAASARKIRKGADHCPYVQTFGGDMKAIGHKPWVREGPKIGRNEKCPCGSGFKYKKCCEVINGKM